MKKNVGFHVRLVPVAAPLDEFGRGMTRMDDDWIIEDVSNDEVRISNTRTGHATLLGKDHIYSYTSNPDRSPRHGFLTLNVQIFFYGDRLDVRPNSKPGEPVVPPDSESLRNGSTSITRAIAVFSRS